MIDKKEMLDKFSKIKIKNISIVQVSRRNSYWVYLSDNKVDTLLDLYNLYRKEYDAKEFNSYSAKNLGILNLCLFKYCGICRKGIIELLDSELGVYSYFLSSDDKKSINSFRLLGLDFSDIKCIHAFRKPGKKMIEYIRDFVSYNEWSKEKINLFSLLINYYDSYYLKLDNQKGKKI